MGESTRMSGCFAPVGFEFSSCVLFAGEFLKISVFVYFRRAKRGSSLT
jgi:hypothetical protein